MQGHMQKFAHVVEKAVWKNCFWKWRTTLSLHLLSFVTQAQEVTTVISALLLLKDERTFHFMGKTFCQCCPCSSFGLKSARRHFCFRQCSFKFKY